MPLITPEEITPVFGELEGVTDEMVTALVDIFEAKNAGLVENRDKILEELRASKDVAKPFDEAGFDSEDIPKLSKLKAHIAGMSDEDFDDWHQRLTDPPPDNTDEKDTKLQEVLDATKAQHRKDLAAQAKVHKTELENSKKDAEAWKDKYNWRVKSSQVNAALEAAGVRSQVKRNLLVDTFTKKADWSPDGDGAERVTIDHTDLPEFFERWGQTPDGKEFVEAPINDGGGAPGSNGSSKSHSVSSKKELTGPENRRKMIEFQNKYGKAAFDALPA